MDKMYMNLETGSVDNYAGWWYENEDGETVNAVDLGEVVQVIKNEDGEWVEGSIKQYIIGITNEAGWVGTVSYDGNYTNVYENQMFFDTEEAAQEWIDENKDKWAYDIRFDIGEDNNA